MQKQVEAGRSTKMGGGSSAITIMGGTRFVDRNRWECSDTEMGGIGSLDNNRWK